RHLAGKTRSGNITNQSSLITKIGISIKIKADIDRINKIDKINRQPQILSNIFRLNSAIPFRPFNQPRRLGGHGEIRIKATSGPINLGKHHHQAWRCKYHQPPPSPPCLRGDILPPARHKKILHRNRYLLTTKQTKYTKNTPTFPHLWRFEEDNRVFSE
ncbi:MAG: hypothetical protein ACLFQ6_12420, partial [Candidatus Sumerlaeia bacterium]